MKSENCYYPSCWPLGIRTYLLCGLTMILIGVFWLADNTGWLIFDWWNYLLPVLLIAWGLAYLIGARREQVGMK